jgi:hypothetical protein
MRVREKYKDRFPSDISEYFDLRWDIRKIWKLELPIHSCPVSDFTWHLDLPVWPSAPPEEIFDISPSMVLAKPHKYPKEIKGIKDCDTQYPIETMRLGKRLVILDGAHRLCRHVLEGAKTIRYRIIPREDFHLVKREDS